MGPRQSRIKFFLISLTFWLFLPAPAHASPESRELIREGVAELQKQRTEAALERFEAAEQADPDDPETLFFQGVALNRLGRHEEALVRLERARAGGSAHPDLDFETGWSLLKLQRWSEAVEALERYERTHPGRGQTSEFLGRAYLGLGELDKAETRLREGLERNPALEPTVLFYLALVDTARGDLAGAGDTLDELLRAAPESPLARRLREQLARRAPAVKPWRLIVSASGGYNSNAIALGENTPLPQDISDEESAFGRFSVDGSYTWSLTERDDVTAGYGLQADLFEEVPEFNLLDHFFYAQLRHALRADVVGSVRVSDQYTEIDGDAFRNQVGVRPALAYRVRDWAVAELAYSFFTSNYFFDTPLIRGRDVRDRDSTTHTVTVLAHLSIPRIKVRGQVGYFHTWNLADGDDFDLDTDGVLLTVSRPLPFRIDGRLFYTRTFDRFDNPNSLAGATGFAFEREDDVDRLTVQLTRPVRGPFSLFARYDYTNNDSNIDFFSYDQHVWSGGIVAEF